MINQYSLVSPPNKVPIREKVEFLKIPDTKNIAIAAHPWANEIITILTKVILDKEVSPTIINVMCVTLL